MGEMLATEARRHGEPFFKSLVPHPPIVTPRLRVSVAALDHMKSAIAPGNDPPADLVY